MATLKVGQRVRIRKDATIDGCIQHLAGCEAVITEIQSFFWRPYRLSVMGYRARAAEEALEPLVDPRESEWADEKIRQLQKLVKEPLPAHPSQLEEA